MIAVVEVVKLAGMFIIVPIKLYFISDHR
jgi:hypothetical protein